MGPFEIADSIVIGANNARLEQGISTQRLADVTRLSRTCIEKWFAGATHPGLYPMAQILDALGYELTVRKKEN